MKKTGRNDPCPCGSGKKFKKCHLGQFDKSIPREVIEHMEKAQAEQSRLEEAGIRINYPRPVIFKGKRVWAFGNRVYVDRPPRETFHEFIIELLRQTLGREWWEGQQAVKDKHFIKTCFDAYYKLKRTNALSENQTPDGLWSVTPDGPTKYLLSLAFDYCSLFHAQKMPQPLLDRLRHRDQFQGARYEIAIAALFARLKFKVEFLDETTSPGTPHYDFNVSGAETGMFGIETKSRHRPGVLHTPGSAEEFRVAKGDVARHFHEALERAPGDKPYFIFIDLNAPFSGSLEAINRGWRGDIRAMLQREPVPSPDAPSDFTGLYVTNMSYHYDEGPSISPNEILEIQAGLPKHPARDPGLFDMIGRALANCGTVPSFDVDGILGTEEPSKAPASSVTPEREGQQ